MIQVGKMNNDTENRFLCGLWGVSITTLLSVLIYKIHEFDILSTINLSNLAEIISIPIVVIITLIVHEAIHISAFKLLGNGQAKIRVRRDKRAGAIVIQQMNSELFYDKKATIVILLAPFVILTIVSVIMLMYIPYPLVIYINCILNAIGSSIDMYVSLRLIFSFPKDVKIKYNNGEEVGMEIYK
jgi:Protein of unknown function (DUF3267).